MLFVILTETRCLLSSDQPGAARLRAARPPLHQRADGLVHHGQPRLAQVGVQFLMRSFDEWHIGNDLQTGQVGWKVVSEPLTGPPPHHGESCLARFWWNLSHMWDVGVELG